MNGISPQLAALTEPISALRPDPKNAKKHGKRSLDAIKESLAKFGQQKPIVADADGVVIAGNGTYEAAKELGWTHIAVVRSSLKGEEARAYALADNRTAELAEWDYEVLADALSGFSEAMREAAGFFPEDVEIVFDHRDNPFRTEKVRIDSLKPHPRNYQTHPDDQLEHIMASIKMHGYYRNIVVANDGTILAGHAVVEASKKMGRTVIPVIRLSISPDDPRALKVLTSDNEISNLAAVDDRALTEMLREIMATEGLEGTGFNADQLATLLMVTRPASEIKDREEAAKWVGMPEYDDGGTLYRLMVLFMKEEDRKEFVDKCGLRIDKNTGTTWSARWPVVPRENMLHLRFESPETTTP